MNDLKPADLANAIRKGATLRPQVTGLYFKEIAPGVLGSCALGAAYEGLTGRTYQGLTMFKFEASCGKIEGFAICPVEGCPTRVEEGLTGSNRHDVGTDFLVNIIAHLNDRHGWTREAVADWLAGHATETEAANG